MSRSERFRAYPHQIAGSEATLWMPSGSDLEAGYFATFGAPNQTGWTRGYLTMVATA